MTEGLIFLSFLGLILYLIVRLIKWLYFEDNKPSKISISTQKVETKIQPNKASTKNSFIAIDFETANAKRHSACAVGLVKVVDNKIVDKYYSLIRPEPLEFNPINIQIHNITANHCATAPLFNQVYLDIVEFIEDLPLYAHNMSFDKSVLEKSCEYYGINPYPFEYNCTMQLYKSKFKDLESYTLPNLASKFLNKEFIHHHALEDAHVCAELRIHIDNIKL